jgi:hypothetical protein
MNLPLLNTHAPSSPWKENTMDNSDNQYLEMWKATEFYSIQPDACWAPLLYSPGAATPP